MVEQALLTNPGGRENNEDYVIMTEYGEEKCFVLCDGLGGHECGEVASSSVAEFVAGLFRKSGDYPAFIDDAFSLAQAMLLELQTQKGMMNAMKTTMVILVVTPELIKWGHIGDSRLYHIYNNGMNYERTKDHSLVQLLVDMGEISEEQMRSHSDRNKLLRVMGSEWGNKSYDKSGVLERDGSSHAFALMTDGFWEYVHENEMMTLQNQSGSCGEWLENMEKLILERADMSRTDNYSAICVRVQ
ncbi:MAG: protein phosphatase 2C domain-containing protein [Lachnospiraceae bacterium]|nr:protein phosphatase 2C domain-containing protein [Lachnospiraceae bacterium]